MNTSEISVPSAPDSTSVIDTPYLESGFAGVVVTVMIILLKVILNDWLDDQKVMRELVKKIMNKE